MNMPIADTVNALRAAFGDLPGHRVPWHEFRGETRVVVPAEKFYEVLKLLKEQHGFDLLVDITCVDYLNYPAGPYPDGTASAWSICWPARSRTSG